MARKILAESLLAKPHFIVSLIRIVFEADCTRSGGFLDDIPAVVLGELDRAHVGDDSHEVIWHIILSPSGCVCHIEGSEVIVYECAEVEHDRRSIRSEDVVCTQYLCWIFEVHAVDRVERGDISMLEIECIILDSAIEHADCFFAIR